jgi:glycerophosphoryl diester phosphodiesterase
MTTTISRRKFVAGAALAFVSQAAIHSDYKLIAHRGGIVDEQHSENSPGSLQAAIDRGYWMIEVDIRRTKDGEPILQHDPDFQRFYGDSRRVEQMTWAEISRLRAQPGGTSPINFRDVCRLCEGKVRLMLDIKSQNFPDDFYIGLGKLLSDNKLLQTAYLLGGGERAAKHLDCYRSLNTRALKEAIARGEDVKKARSYLFEIASNLTQESFELCQASGIPAVAAINTFRYTQTKRDETKGAEEDVARLKKLGVRYYQIDSRYEGLFF